jgi:predicted membrane channel-forming protein YqfA (hemolysin III family)
MADLGREKIQELGAVGALLGLLWILGLIVLYDLMDGAFREGFVQAGNSWLGVLAVWFVIGAVVYLWRDPHGVRASRVG